MKRLYIDLETTGLEPADGHTTLSIGAAIDDSEDDSFYDEFSVTIKPTKEEWEKASPDALRVNGFTWESLQAEGTDKRDAVDMFCSWLLGHDVVAGETAYIGQNPAFDVKFLNALMASELEWLGNPLSEPINVIDLAKQYASASSVKFKSFSGANIAKAIGVEPEPALHVAIGGVRACRRNYLKLNELLSQLSGDME